MTRVQNYTKPSNSILNHNDFIGEYHKTQETEDFYTGNTLHYSFVAFGKLFINKGLQ